MAKRVEPEALSRAVDAYFASCDATAERTLLKSGAPAYRQLPYTPAGLAEAAGMSVAELRSRAGTGRRREREILSAALRRVERYLVERALLGELQYSVAALLLRDLGYGAEGDAPGGDRVVIVMDDRERWGD